MHNQLRVCRAAARVSSSDRRGSVLILSYLVVSALLVSGYTSVTAAMNEQRLAQVNHSATSAFHLAEAAVDEALANLRDDDTSDISSTAFMGGGSLGTSPSPLWTTVRLHNL